MKKIYTIGHSTRKFQDLIEILQEFKIEVLVDIRRFPRSLYNPQFNKEVLEKELQPKGILYIWNENLGGFRREGYLVYTESKEFKEGFKELVKVAEEKTTVIMCAEILWFKCHRKFVANKLEEAGFKTIHILNGKKVFSVREKTDRDLHKDKPSQLSLW
ncbi:MAG: DUF488 family protein [Planctomycetota bacterium]